MPYARMTDPETSHEAARSVTNVTATQRAIMDIAEEWIHGFTDEDLGRVYQIRLNLDYPYPLASDSGLRSRRAELVKKGMLQDSGERRKLVSGRHAIVWVKSC